MCDWYWTLIHDQYKSVIRAGVRLCYGNGDLGAQVFSPIKGRAEPATLTASLRWLRSLELHVILGKHTSSTDGPNYCPGVGRIPGDIIYWVTTELEWWSRRIHSCDVWIHGYNIMIKNIWMFFWILHAVKQRLKWDLTLSQRIIIFDRIIIHNVSLMKQNWKSN